MPIKSYWYWQGGRFCLGLTLKTTWHFERTHYAEPSGDLIYISSNILHREWLKKALCNNTLFACSDNSSHFLWLLAAACSDTFSICPMRTNAPPDSNNATIRRCQVQAGTDVQLMAGYDRLEQLLLGFLCCHFLHFTSRILYMNECNMSLVS